MNSEILVKDSQSRTAALGRYFHGDGKSIVTLSDRQRRAKRSLTSKLQSGEYRFVEMQCLCGATPHEAVLLSEKDRYGFSLKTWLCKRCTLIYASPYFDEPSLNLFYANDYRDIYESETGATDLFFQRRFVVGKNIVRFVRAFIPSLEGRVIFEVGCASGGILQAFAEEGAVCLGCDLDERFLNYGRNKGLHLMNADFLSDGFIPEECDLIVLAQVLEHLRQPREALRRIRGALKRGGHLYVEVPNVVSRIDFLGHLQNAHVWYFDRHTLESLLNECGFQLVVGEEPSIILQVLATPCEPRASGAAAIYRPKLRAFRRAERRRSMRRDVGHVLDTLGLRGTVRRLRTRAREVVNRSRASWKRR